MIPLELNPRYERSHMVYPGRRGDRYLLSYFWFLERQKETYQHSPVIKSRPNHSCLQRSATPRTEPRVQLNRIMTGSLTKILFEVVSDSVLAMHQCACSMRRALDAKRRQAGMMSERTWGRNVLEAAHTHPLPAAQPSGSTGATDSLAGKNRRTWAYFLTSVCDESFISLFESFSWMKTLHLFTQWTHKRVCVRARAYLSLTHTYIYAACWIFSLCVREICTYICIYICICSVLNSLIVCVWIWERGKMRTEYQQFNLDLPQSQLVIKYGTAKKLQIIKILHPYVVHVLDMPVNLIQQ